MKKRLLRVAALVAAVTLSPLLLLWWVLTGSHLLARLLEYALLGKYETKNPKQQSINF